MTKKDYQAFATELRLQKPGSKFGPCVKGCKHVDCLHMREDAKSTCRFCSKAIGYGKNFFRSRLDGCLAHASCFEDAANRNDARVGRWLDYSSLTRRTQ